MARAAVAAFLGLMEVPEDQIERYEQWHALDHLPENLAIPGIVFGQRWRATPAICNHHQSHHPSLGIPQFLITYFFSEPLESALEDWNALAEQLQSAGRMFAGRLLRFGGLFAFEHREVSANLHLSARALPLRPHAGVYLHLAKETEYGADDEARFRTLLERPGVAGGIRLASAGAHEYGKARGGRVELYFAHPGTSLMEAFAEVPVAEDLVFAGCFGPSQV